MCQVETIKVGELPARHRARWLTLLESAGFQSPLLHPDFALHVARHRSDVRILVARDDQGREAYMGVHKTASGCIRPIGGALSDYHGWVAEPGFDAAMSDLLKAADLDSFRYFALLKPGYGVPGDGRGLAADISAGDTASLIRAHKPSRAKQFRRLDRKLEKEQGEVELVIDDADDRAYTALMGWKTAQFAATGRHNILGTGWIAGLLDDVRRTHGDSWGGQLVTLRAGGKPVAAELGPFWNGIFHPWIAAYDVDYAAYSPGHLLVRRLLKAMSAETIRRYDLGADDAPYKQEFANTEIATYSGLVTADGGYRAQPHLTGHTIFNKAARRWEQIVLAEPTLTGRLAGLAGAGRALLPGA
ncbi:GNAT family N-acetyltransferase [Hyphobacterium sp. HN65]|uniref:GNAT family N-acetyltransferase n=1 Tax=Hyphobacterium lacteum TaxID=3116575 RepID=A0ABU7LRK9_9PROT|nr:GNAT family N-acetyltransferase [Hyphobacterium sp. HN65]MEE2526543.1 GNAT family N-acetyltransferase [Hyphobacterium sp. HN65]